jgi:transposase InsO family protein
MTADEAATKRFETIAPLLAPDLDKGRYRELMSQISEESGFSERTLRRYVASWKDGGFNALKPIQGYSRPDSKLPETFDAIVDAAVVLRRECPARSVADIIFILELEGAIEQGSVSRSTLQRRLAEKGYSASQMKMYAKTGAAARRFQKQHRGQLWQSDIKYGPYVAPAPGKKPCQIYLFAFIDDATRYITAARFYTDQTVSSLEDCFRRAVQAYGAPEKIFVDNGKQYRSNWFDQACAKIGTKRLFARPYHPEAKGKIERLNKEFGRLIAEVVLAKPKTIDECNEYLGLWIDDYYHNHNHSGIESISPKVAFLADTRPLRYLSADIIKDAFAHTVTRKVDKCGCISFGGDTYEVGLTWIGQTLEFRFDVAHTGFVELLIAGQEPIVANKLEISQNCGTKPDLPEHMQGIEPDSSRFIDALKSAHKPKESGEIATSFAEFWGDGGNV